MSGFGAFAVPDASAVPAVRRAVQRLAEALGFPSGRAGQAALVATELGTNLAKHARQGEILLAGDTDTIEILALDRGPGIGDVAMSLRDGYSTSGTPGEGLGAVSRQSDFVDIYTTASGTAILARLRRAAHPTTAAPSRLDVGGIRVHAPGEAVCGDDWEVRLRPARLVVMLADGLGHGLAAHDAARAARETFADAHEQSALEIVAAIHAALASTRGAAVAVFAADLERGVARYCGLGNVAATILDPYAARHSLVSMPGTAGVGRPRLLEFQYPFPPEATLVMHSDGIAPNWDLTGYPGLRLKAPSLVAGVLFRDFARRRDDATAVVVKERGRA